MKNHKNNKSEEKSRTERIYNVKNTLDQQNLNAFQIEEMENISTDNWDKNRFEKEVNSLKALKKKVDDCQTDFNKWSNGIGAKIDKRIEKINDKMNRL